jgi:DNA polymerase III subunit epsilon
MAHEKDITISYFDGTVPEFSKEASGEIVKVAVVAAETKGKNPRHAKLIELSVVVLEVERESWEITGVLENHNWFQDPEEEEAFSPAFTEATGISQEMVAGKSVDSRAFEEIIDSVDFFVAYNAGYVRPVLQEQFPNLESAIFACVRNQIDWSTKGYESRSLNHLTKDHFWYNDSLRMQDRCAILIKLLSEKKEGQEISYLQELCERAEEPLITIEAQVGHREKYLMKKERFRWDPREKTFLRCMGSSTLERVRKSLNAKGFQGELIERDRKPASERFK